MPANIVPAAKHTDGPACKYTTTTTETSHSTPYKNNASMILPARVDGNSPERDQQLLSVAKTLCPFLGDSSDDDESSSPSTVPTFHNSKKLTVEPLTGGLSNLLFVVRSLQGESVLVRLYSSSSTLIDRDDENVLLAWLSSQHLAPAFYGRFENGRVEEFYDGYVPLNVQKMPLYGDKMATLLAQLHSANVPETVLSHNKTGWNSIEAWLDLLKEQEQQESSSCPSASMDESGGVTLDDVQCEFQWLRRQLTATTSDGEVTQYCRQVVFCHFDAQSLNFLIDANGNDVKLIDFEYAGYYPRVADIANTFLEYCDMNHLKANFETEYPSDKLQDDFLRAYFAHVQDAPADIAQELHIVRHEIGKHTLISHLQWTVWSLLQHLDSQIDFDYLAYARERMEGYHYFKTKFFTAEEREDTTA